MGLTLTKTDFEVPPFDPNTWAGTPRPDNYNGKGEWPFRRIGGPGFGRNLTPKRGVPVPVPPKPWRFGVPNLPAMPSVPLWPFWLWEAGDWYDRYFLPDPNNNARPDRNYWAQVNVCQDPLAFPPGPFGHYWDNCDTRGFECIGGQAPGSGWYLNFGTGNQMWNITDTTKWWSYEVGGGSVVRAQQRESWVRIQSPDPSHLPDAELVPATGYAPPEPNPNFQRTRPNRPEPAPNRQPVHEHAPVRAVAVDYSPHPGLPPKTTPRLAPVAPPSRGGPPDHKVMPRGVREAQYIARALGGLSEAAEVVEAVYQALPEDVRIRWERGRDLDSHPFGGQYAVSKDVPWKLQAIYYNWRRLDVNKALQGIAVNAFSDQFYGRAFGAQDPRALRNRAIGVR